MNRLWVSAGIVAFAIAFAVWGGMQWQRNQVLRLTVEIARDQSRDHARLLAENRRLAALQPSEAELARLRADRAALSRLQSEVATSRAHTEQLERTVKKEEPPVTLVPAGEWKNAGRTSPAAAIESLFWASARADVVTLASGLSLDASTRELAETLWRQLPATTQAGFGSPAGMIATALAQDGAQIAFMGVVSETNTSPDTVVVKTRLENSEHQGKTENFEFRRTDDGWRLVIPAKALARYETALKAQR